MSGISNLEHMRGRPKFLHLVVLIGSIGLDDAKVHENGPDKGASLRAVSLHDLINGQRLHVTIIQVPKFLFQHINHVNNVNCLRSHELVLLIFLVFLYEFCL